MLHHTVVQLDLLLLTNRTPTQREREQKGEKKEKKNRNVLFDHPN